MTKGPPRLCWPRNNLKKIDLIDVIRKHEYRSRDLISVT